MINIDEKTEQILHLKNPTKREVSVIVKLIYLQGREDEIKINKNNKYEKNMSLKKVKPVKGGKKSK